MALAVAIGCAHLTLLFGRYGSQAVVAIDFAHNKYFFVPFVLPVAAFFIGLAWERYIAAAKLSTRARRQAVGAIAGGLALCMAVALFAPLEDELGIDRVARDQFRGVAAAVQRLSRNLAGRSTAEQIALGDAGRAVRCGAPREECCSSPKAPGCPEKPATADQVRELIASQLAGTAIVSRTNDLTTYFMAITVDRRPSMAALVADRIEYVFDGALALSVLALVTLISLRRWSAGKTEPEFLTASGYAVFATFVLLMWPPLDLANIEKLRVFDPSASRVSPFVFAPLYLAAVAILVTHHVQAEVQLLVVGAAAVVAAVANLIGWLKPVWTSQVLQLGSVTNFVLLGITSLVSFVALGLVFILTFRQRPPGSRSPSPTSAPAL